MAEAVVELPPHPAIKLVKMNRAANKSRTNPLRIRTSSEKVSLKTEQVTRSTRENYHSVNKVATRSYLAFINFEELSTGAIS